MNRKKLVVLLQKLAEKLAQGSNSAPVFSLSTEVDELQAAKEAERAKVIQLTAEMSLLQGLIETLKWENSDLRSANAAATARLLHESEKNSFEVLKKRRTKVFDRRSRSRRKAFT